MDLDGHTGDPRQRLLQEHGAGTEFVKAWSMTRPSGQDDDPLVGLP